MSHQGESDTYLQPYGGDGLIGTPPTERERSLMGLLHPGDHRLLDDVSEIDDRGLEMAEELIHQQRHLNDRTGQRNDLVERALTALSGVRALTKRAA